MANQQVSNNSKKPQQLQNVVEVTDSKCIKAMSYDPQTKTLFLKFNESPFYFYTNINQEIYTMFLNHPKKGKFYHEIKSSLGEPTRLDN